jgi:HSP20 family protein
MFLPLVDVFEQLTEIVILVDVPGVDRRDIHISWKDNILTVSGAKRQHCEPGARFMRVERSYGQFRREIAINVAVDTGNVRTELIEGLMRIHLPKVG